MRDRDLEFDVVGGELPKYGGQAIAVNDLFSLLLSRLVLSCLLSSFMEKEFIIQQSLCVLLGSRVKVYGASW